MTAVALCMLKDGALSVPFNAKFRIKITIKPIWTGYLADEVILKNAACPYKRVHALRIVYCTSMLGRMQLPSTPAASSCIAIHAPFLPIFLPYLLRSLQLL